MDQKANILGNALKMFMKYGIKSVTMDDLSRSLGMSKKTLYQYVKNKEDLLEQLIAFKQEMDLAEMLEVRTESLDAIDSLLKITLKAADKVEMVSQVTIYDLKKYYPTIWQSINELESEQIYRLMLDNLNRGKAEELYRDDIVEDFVARLYVGHAMMIVDEQLFPLATYPRKQLVLSLMTHHLRSIVTEKGKALLQKRLAELNHK